MGMDKIVSVVHGNRDFDPIRSRAKIAIFDFDSIIVTSLMTATDTTLNTDSLTQQQDASTIHVFEAHNVLTSKLTS